MVTGGAVVVVSQSSSSEVVVGGCVVSGEVVVSQSSSRSGAVVVGGGVTTMVVNVEVAVALVVQADGGLLETQAHRLSTWVIASIAVGRLHISHKTKRK